MLLVLNKYDLVEELIQSGHEMEEFMTFNYLQDFAEEHGFIDIYNCECRPSIGDILRVVPNHVCVVVNMFDQLVAVRGNRIVDIIPVDARGRLV